MQRPIDKAITAWHAEQDLHPSLRRSMRRIASDNDVPHNTLSTRLSGKCTTRQQSHENFQALTTTEEEVLVKYIYRMTRFGFPLPCKTAHDIAAHIRQTRLLPTLSPLNPRQPLGKNWVHHFKDRHKEVFLGWTKALEGKRIDVTQPDLLRKWFDELLALQTQYRYETRNIFNMDETGYSMGTTQSTQVMAYVDPRSEGVKGRHSRTKVFKPCGSRTEWITAIECVSADGTSLPPVIIFKGKGRARTEWLPETGNVEGWKWMTSEKGWTNHHLGYLWLVEHFEPLTRPEDINRRLLILDGHGSHVSGTLIAHGMQVAIDVLILPPHSSHITQPIDVGIFRPLKQSMALEADTAAVYTPGTIKKKAWCAWLARAREKALKWENIVSV